MHGNSINPLMRQWHPVLPVSKYEGYNSSCNAAESVSGTNVLEATGKAMPMTERTVTAVSCLHDISSTDNYSQCNFVHTACAKQTKQQQLQYTL
jgi:hypothetical protein